MNIRIVRQDGKEEILKPEIITGDNKTTIRLSKDKLTGNIKHVDFLYDYFVAHSGDKGYFVLPFEAVVGVCVTYFRKRENMEHTASFSHLSCYGYKKDNGGVLGIITGCREYYAVVAGVKDGIYYAYPRFLLDGFEAQEDIEIEYYTLKDGDYSEMARLYRQVQLERYGCIPLVERIKDNKALARAAEGIAVRVRQGWKPAPSEVENQTIETEPPMHVACDFEKTGKLLDEFADQGIKNAEFCLVGWNRMGHDGRYPQIFPVEPKLGGEEKLRELIKKAQALGYNMVGHDNASDAYTVSEQWDEEYLLKNRDGSFYKMDVWSSGRAYKICPKRYYELFADEHLNKMRELGFEGIHYMDVITILTLLECHDANHPLTRKEAAKWYEKLMLKARDIFGGFSSEAGYDFAANALDYVMYTSLNLPDKFPAKICDEYIPFWQIVYHGIILYNPATYTLNYTAKGVDNRLKFFEYGGRPLVCVYANFAKGKDWMGKEDMRLDTEQEMKETVAKIKTMAEDYEWLKEVRYAFMESHTRIADGVYEIVYSGGIKIVVDYNRATVRMTGENINKEIKL